MPEQAEQPREPQVGDYVYTPLSPDPAEHKHQQEQLIEDVLEQRGSPAEWFIIVEGQVRPIKYRNDRWEYTDVPLPPGYAGEP